VIGKTESGRWPILFGVVALSVVSALVGFQSWDERDPFWLFAWLLPLAAALVAGWIDSLLRPAAAITEPWLGRRVLYFAIAAYFSAWFYLPILEAEAVRQANNKTYGPVHGIMVEGRVRVFHALVPQAGAIWLIAAIALVGAAGLLRAPLLFGLVGFVVLHALYVGVYSFLPLD
jgi:hypothetical protein